MDEIYQKLATLQKAHGDDNDILKEQVKDLKEIITELLRIGELDNITFTDEAATKLFQYWVKKAKIATL